MRVTRLGRDFPLLQSGYGAVTQIPSSGDAGQVPTSNGSNGVYFGPNVATITANGSNTLLGPFVNIASGSNTVFSVSSNTLTINALAIGGGGGGATTITTQEEGATLSSAVTTLDFVGAGVTASGAGATTTITIPGGGGGGGGYVLLEQHTASASATLDFTSFISSTYDTYEFVLIGLINATNTQNLAMQMGTGGGPTYDTGANYGSTTWEFRAGGGGAGGAEGGAGGIGLIRNFQDNSTNFKLSGRVTLFDPQGAYFKQIIGNLSYAAATPFRINSIASGTYESTTAVTAVRFFYSSGNITSGTIRVYGLEK